MNETNIDWDDLRLFLEVARQGGLAAAAALTGKSKPTLGRRMLALEQRLGEDLFERLPRGYALTDQGRLLLAKVVELEDRISPIVAKAKGEPLRRVKISAGTWVTHMLCQRIAALVGRDPVLLQFISADQVLDIGHREAVIGIRNRRPEQLGLAGRRITRVRFAAYAVNAEVETWACVVGSTPSARWVGQNIGNAPSVEVTNPRSALDLALAGAARVVLPTFIGNSHGSLVQIVPEIEELEHEQWLVTHNEDRFVPQVRRTIDRVHATLKQAIS